MYRLTLKEALEKLNKKEISSLELTNAVLERIESQEKQINAYITVLKESALEQALAADKKRAAGENLPLLGVPIAIKDNMNLVGRETTCASKMLKGYKSVYTATVVQRLIDAGAVIIGKTNLDEFAMGSSTENSAIKNTVNPWSFDRVPGGSSGGSAAAVAADECIAAIGSDTGGSIRQPASFCGIVGMKPTYGTVSRYGLVALASSLDQIGPMTKTVEDAAILLNVLAGQDENDMTSIATGITDYGAEIGQDIKGLKIGVIKELMSDVIDANVLAVINDALTKAAAAGAIIEEVSMPSFKYALSVYCLVATSEASANLARFDGVRFGHRNKEADNIDEMFSSSRDEGFGPEVKRRIMLGTHALSAGYYEDYYLKAQKVRTLIQNDYKKAFAKYDLLLSPTCPTVAFKFGEKVNNPLNMYLSDIATIPLSLAGYAGLSLPCGLAENLPVGLQLSSNALQETKLFKAAAALEKIFGFKRKEL